MIVSRIVTCEHRLADKTKPIPNRIVNKKSGKLYRFAARKLISRSRVRIGGVASIKLESRIAVSGFQTRPHAYFVAVRTVVNSRPRVRIGPMCSPSLFPSLHPSLSISQPFSPRPHRIATAQLCHGFTDNVAGYTCTRWTWTRTRMFSYTYTYIGRKGARPGISTGQ